MPGDAAQVSPSILGQRESGEGHWLGWQDGSAGGPASSTGRLTRLGGWRARAAAKLIVLEPACLPATVPVHPKAFLAPLLCRMSHDIGCQLEARGGRGELAS